MRLIDFFAGVCRFSVAEGDAVRLLNILMKARLVYRGFTVTGSETDGETGGEPGGTAVLFCSARTAHRLAVLCDAAGIGHSVRTVYGLPAMKKTLIRRADWIKPERFRKVVADSSDILRRNLALVTLDTSLDVPLAPSKTPDFDEIIHFLEEMEMKKSLFALRNFAKDQYQISI